MFIALKGENFDGNRFAMDSLRQGAKFAVVDSDIAKNDARLIKVDSGLETLQKLAQFHRRYLGVPVLAITGSNGKTTTKELIGAILSSSYDILITEGNLNNHIGVPLTILRGTKNHEIAVIEMGANHKGEIRELCEIADPDLGLITNIGKAHLEGFGSLNGVLEGKTELFEHLTKKGGKILLNRDQPLLVSYTNGQCHLSYGSGNDCDVQGFASNVDGKLHVEWAMKNGVGYHSLTTGLVGSYNLDNVLAAVTVGLYFGVSKEIINDSIQSYVPSNNRSELKASGTNRVIWDAYNANPSSMKAALDNIRSFDHPKIVLILGEMKEGGVDTISEHRELVTHAESMNPDRLYLVGQTFTTAGVDKSVYENVATLLDHLKANPIQDSLILIKGSRSNQLEQLQSVFS